ncbi:MAG: LCP family protein [Actinomycetota bacterium]|nr:LCP family protein [Actinomycetota bacterium]
MSPPTPSPTVPQEEVLAPPRSRRWRHRLLVGANVVVALTLLTAGATYGYLKFRFGQLDKPDIPCGVLRNCGNDDPGQPMNVLLVGSDSRKDLSPAERQFGSERQVGGQRSDTILVLRADPRKRTASIISIPRDLAVPIAGSSSTQPQRINTAYERGPEGLITTIRQSLGIEIDHYAQVDFNGFRGVVQAVGGVTVYFPAPARDKLSGLDIRRPGCVELNGDQALSYVRSREYQYFESGRWHMDPTGDLGRIQRQQDFIRRVMRKASGVGRNPVTLNSLVGTAVKNVSIDRSFSESDLLRLSKRFRSLEPDAVEMLSLPTVDSRVGDAAVLRLKQPEARQVIDHFLGRDAEPKAAQPGVGSVPNIAPNRVRVRVLNGTGTDGQAGKAAQELQGVGFNLAGTGDADRSGYTEPVIHYGRGQQEKAELLKAYLGGAAQVQEDRTIQGVDLVLITGSELGEVRPPTQAGRPTTVPTTKPAATTPTQPKGGPPQAPC